MTFPLLWEQLFYANRKGQVYIRRDRKTILLIISRNTHVTRRVTWVFREMIFLHHSKAGKKRYGPEYTHHISNVIQKIFLGQNEYGTEYQIAQTEQHKRGSHEKTELRLLRHKHKHVPIKDNKANHTTQRT